MPWPLKTCEARPERECKAAPCLSSSSLPHSNKADLQEQQIGHADKEKGVSTKIMRQCFVQLSRLQIIVSQYLSSYCTSKQPWVLAFIYKQLTYFSEWANLAILVVTQLRSYCCSSKKEKYTWFYWIAWCWGRCTVHNFMRGLIGKTSWRKKGQPVWDMKTQVYIKSIDQSAYYKYRGAQTEVHILLK